jgi:hypothetical protein
MVWFPEPMVWFPEPMVWFPEPMVWSTSVGEAQAPAVSASAAARAATTRRTFFMGIPHLF